MPVAAPTLVARVLDWIKARPKRESELAALSDIDLHMLASDIGVTAADLRDLVPRFDDHSELMDQMLRARGLSPTAVREALRGAVRDMEVTCARCRDSGLCRRELAAGTAREHSHEFCPNSGAMDDLLEIGI